MFTNDGLFTINKFTNARFDCIKLKHFTIRTKKNDNVRAIISDFVEIIIFTWL